MDTGNRGGNFDLLDRVRVTDGSHKGLVGYVTGERVEGDVQLYEVTCGASSHWVPVEWLEGAIPFQPLPNRHLTIAFDPFSIARGFW